MQSRVETFQQVGRDQSFSLVQNGLLNLADVVLVSSVNYVVDGFDSLKTSKLCAIFGTSNIMGLTVTELCLSVGWS